MPAPAAQTAPASPLTAEAGGSALISRQPVLDGDRRVTGYRVAYAVAPDVVGARSVADAPAGLGDGMPTSDRAATRLFGDIVSVVGLEELVGDALAHLPLSRSLLLNLGVPPVRPDRVVLRVAYQHALDPELADILDALAGRGYALSLYDLPGPALESELLHRFGIVEVNFAAWQPDALRAVVDMVVAERGAVLAVGLRTDGGYNAAKAIGCTLFAGSFYSSPSTTEVRDVPVGALSTLAAVARVQGAGATVEDLEAVIDRDLGLSVKLLRYINSAYFGTRSKITSIRQAVMMLGARGVARWALMVALTGGTAAPTELSTMALTRGRMCELLAAGRADVGPDELFLIGLLSLADALLDTPIDNVVAELPLADHVAAALLERKGPAGEILDAVTSYEVGSFDAHSVLALRGNVSAAYMDALRWARESVQGLG